MPTALGGRTPYGELYGAKPDVSHLRAFGGPCTIVEPKERLKKLDYRATMSFLVGYKYEGGGPGGLGPEKTPKRQVVVGSREIVFFEDGLPSPTLNDPPPRPIYKDESVPQPVLDHSIKPTTPPDTANAPALSPPSAATPAVLPEVTH